MEYYPCYKWDRMVYDLREFKYPKLIHYKKKEKLINVKKYIGGSYFEEKSNWFRCRQRLCEDKIFLYNLTNSQYFIIKNGIVIHPQISNLNCFTDYNDCNILYIVVLDNIIMKLEFKTNEIILTEFID